LDANFSALSNLIEPNVCGLPWLADPTGVTDSTLAVNLAFAAGVTAFPAGTFKFSGDITTNETLWANVRGAGKGKTIFKFSNGGLRIPVSGATTYHASTVQGISILTTQAISGTIGVDIYKGTTAGEFTVRIEDVEIGGADGVHGNGTNPFGPSQWWDTCLRLDGVRFVHLDDVMIYGGNAGTTAFGIDISAPDDGSNPGFHYAFTNFSVSSCTVGARVSGWIEGIYWSNFEIFACRDVFVGNHATGTVVGTWEFTNGHMFASRDVFQANRINHIKLVGMQLGRGFPESTGPSSYPGDVIRVTGGGNEDNFQLVGCELINSFPATGSFLSLQNVSGFSISGIQVMGFTATNMIALGGTTQFGTIDGVTCTATVTTAINAGFNTGLGNIALGSSIVAPNATTFLSDNNNKIGAWQAASMAYLTATATNTTGDGTFFTPSGWTSMFDYGQNFNVSSGSYTPKVSGVYDIEFSPVLSNLNSSHTDGSILINTPSGNIVTHCNPWALTLSAGASVTVPVRATVHLNAGQSVSGLVSIGGGTKTVSVLGGSLDRSTFRAELRKQC
jgi:hypothetical protein